MDNLSKFADVINDLLLEHNIKPYNLYKSTGISLSVIHYWLNKTRVPSLKNLIKLSDFFKCSLDYLTGRTEKNIYYQKVTSTFNERLKALMQTQGVSYRKLSKDTLIAVSNLTRFTNGKVYPLLNTAVKLADYFSCSLDYLIGRD